MDRDLLRQQLEYYRDLGIHDLYRRDTVQLAASAGENRMAAAAKKAPEQTAEPSTPVKPPEARKEQIVPVKLPPSDADVVPPLLTSDVLVKPPQPSILLPSLAPENDTLRVIRDDIGDCTRCRLSEARKKIVFGSGNEAARLVFVGEGPGADEDEQGIPFVGRAGQLLTQMINNTAAKEGIPIQREDVYICNVVKCRPPENRTPLPDEMQTCGQFLYRQLMVIKPKAICALGATAAKALLNTKVGITKMRGEWQQWNNIPVMVTYHPSYLLRQYNQQAKREAWEDLKKVLHFVYD
jgi:uracil-DNA glycosylase